MPARVARTAFAGARPALALLLFINLFNYIDRQVLAAVVPSIEHSFFGAGAGSSVALQTLQDWCREHLGFKPELALIGVLSMAFMVLYMIGAPVFGRLAERHSRWALVGIGVALWSLASGASGLAATFLGLLLTRCFVGVGEAAYGPVAPTLLSDFYPVEKRGQVLSWFYMAIPVGSALGYVLGGAVAASSINDLGARLLGIHAESWRWAFFLVVPLGLALGLWAFFMKDPPRGRADGPAAAAPVRTGWRDYTVLLRTPSWVFCTLGMTAMTFAIGGIAFWMPYYLAHKPGAPASATVLFGGVTCVAGLVATLAGGIAGDRLRARFPGSYFLVSGTAMLVGFPFLMLTLSATFPSIWVWLFVTCFCLFFNTGPTNTILANVTHPSIRAAGFALNIFVIHAFGDVLSPVVIGVVGDRYNMERAFILVGILFVVAGVWWLLGARHLERDTTLAPTRLRAGAGLRASNSGGAAYGLVRALCRLLLKLFYARIEVVGAEHLPATGPVIIAANHHNSIVDAMLLLAVIPRPLRTLAKAPLFHHPLIGPFLRLMGALPVHRRQEAGDDPARNAALFAATTETLRAGGTILIFPEGRTQPEPVLQEIRTGTARILLAAGLQAPDGPEVTLLPVGLVFRAPGTFRAGRALVLIGAPIPTADCLGPGAPPAGQAVRILTDRLAGALRAQIVEADDRHILRLLELVEELWHEQNGGPPPDETARVAWLKRGMVLYHSLLERVPDRVAAFRRELEDFNARLEKAGLAAVHLSRAYSFGVVSRFAVTEGLPLVLGAPLALCGIVLHVVPYQLTAAAVRLLPHTDEEEATDKIAAGLVLFPLAWLAEACALFALRGGLALVLFLAALLPTGFFALAWRERLERVGREARAFARFLRDRDLPRRLRQRRQALAADMMALVRLASEAPG
jgi:1-acyl-sn-glycerol-3-phosphate acyltransferase